MPRTAALLCCCWFLQRGEQLLQSRVIILAHKARQVRHGLLHRRGLRDAHEGRRMGGISLGNVGGGGIGRSIAMGLLEGLLWWVRSLPLCSHDELGRHVWRDVGVHVEPNVGGCAARAVKDLHRILPVFWAAVSRSLMAMDPLEHHMLDHLVAREALGVEIHDVAGQPHAEEGVLDPLDKFSLELLGD